MIRVNLLPSKRRGGRGPAVASSSGQNWVAIVIGLLLLEIAGLFWFHSKKLQELKAHRITNMELEKQIAEASKGVSEHAEVKKKLETQRAREEAIQKLLTARTGPASVLLELAKVLTPGRGPSIAPDELRRRREENPLAVFNPSWDPRRMWVTGFVEQGRTMRLDGAARDAEDVSELARRLDLSGYFGEIRILAAKKSEKLKGVPMLSFQLEAKVKY